MTNSNWDAALADCDELDRLLRDAMPRPDQARLDRIRVVVARLQGSGNPYVANKAGMIASRAAIYLSARRHEKEPGGADEVMRTMRLSLLGGIREQLRTLKRGEML